MNMKRSAFLLLAVAVCGSGAARLSERAGEPTIVYIVRHAEKKSGEQLSEKERKDDRQVDLLPEGYARADVLAWMLRDVKFDAVYSTDYKRTRMTVKPVADRQSLDVQTLDPQMRRAVSTIRSKDQTGKTLLMCGHSNTIPPLLKELGVEISEKILKGYDDFFVVVHRRDGDGAVGSVTLQHIHYPGRR